MDCYSCLDLLFNQNIGVSSLLRPVSGESGRIARQGAYRADYQPGSSWQVLKYSRRWPGPDVPVPESHRRVHLGRPATGRFGRPSRFERRGILVAPGAPPPSGRRPDADPVNASPTFVRLEVQSSTKQGQASTAHGPRHVAGRVPRVSGRRAGDRHEVTQRWPTRGPPRRRRAGSPRTTSEPRRRRR